MKLTVKKRFEGATSRIVTTSNALSRLVGRIYVSKRIIDLTEAAKQMGIELRNGLLISVLHTPIRSTSCTVSNRFGYIDVSYYNGSRLHSGVSLTLIGTVAEGDLYLRTDRLFNFTEE